MMIYHFRLILGLLVVLLNSSTALPATFSVPLMEVNPAPGGNYLTADFDFDVHFSQIDSATVEFVMPGGYEGSGGTTGNSSWFSGLVVSIHDPAEPMDLAFDNGSLLGAWATTTLSQSLLHVRPNVPANVTFGRVSPSLGGEAAEMNWPDFLHAGGGRVTFVSVRRSSYHPLPTGEEVRSSKSYAIPGEIGWAMLTIVGTAVPEPCTTTLIVIGCLAASNLLRRR